MKIICELNNLGQAQKLTSGVRPRVKVSFGYFMSGPDPRGKKGGSHSDDSLPG